jgi:hypothetical protein
MAPQTDMQGNTGAMPQAPMMPEEQPQMMAGGGIVALRDGGSVRSPELVVRNGRMFKRDPATGELVPLLGGETGAMTEPRPSPRVMDPTLGADLFGPRIGDVAPAMPPASPATMPFAGGVLDSVPDEPLFSPPTSISQVPASAVYTGEDEMFTGVSPLAPQPQPAPNPISPGVQPGGLSTVFMSPVTRNWVDRADELLSQGQISQAEYDALTRGSMGDRSEVIRRVATGVEAPIPFEERLPPAMTTGAGIVLPEDITELLPPREDGTSAVSPDPQAVAEAEALAAAQAAGQSGGAAGAAGPSGGGIAALSGAAAASPSQFEQELLDMMAAREKRAEQDKWLSLAQFGLQLMSSKEPTLGGAIGEAGAPALETLRSGRESSEADRLGMLNMLEQYRMGQAQLALSQQAAAARAAAGSGGGDRAVPAAVINNLMGQLSEIETELARLPAPPAPGIFGGQKQDRNAAARTQLTESRDRIRDVLNAAGAQYGLPLGGMPGAGLIPLN